MIVSAARGCDMEVSASSDIPAEVGICRALGGDVCIIWFSDAAVLITDSLETSRSKDGSVSQLVAEECGIMTYPSWPVSEEVALPLVQPASSHLSSDQEVRSNLSQTL